MINPRYLYVVEDMNMEVTRTVVSMLVKTLMRTLSGGFKPSENQVNSRSQFVNLKLTSVIISMFEH